MIIRSNFKRILKIILLNIVLLITIYFLSVNFSKNLIFTVKYEYKNIEINNLINKISVLNRDLKAEYRFNSEKFLTDYFEYLSKQKKILSLAPCNPDILDNNLRNVRIYNVKLIDNFESFDVAIITNNISKNNFNIDKCFDYFFTDNLNKYFIERINNLNEELKFKINFLLELNQKIQSNKDDISLEIKKSELLLEYNKKLKYFVDPKNNYRGLNKNSHVLYMFLTLLLLSGALQIGYFKIKQISKLINRFIYS